MDKLDFKKADKAYYSGKVGRFDLLTIPMMQFLMIDGEGDPNTSPSYAASVAALYGLAYGIKARCKKDLARDHVVAPLEGLWWADDMAAFKTRQKGKWKWRMCLRQPEHVSRAMFEEVREDVVRKTARKKDAPTDEPHIRAVRLRQYDEGLVVQVLHLGSYEDETAVLEKMYSEVIADQGLRMHGLHHEIYLSDPRRVPAEKLKTILRQPVEKA